MEVQQVETTSPEGEAGGSPSGKIKRNSESFLNKPLSRTTLGAILSWSLRVGVLLFSVFLLIQPNAGQWRGAFNLGFAFIGVAIGVFLTFRILSFPDLTIEGSYATGGCVTAALIVNQANTFWGNPWVATIVATGCGALAGVATGILHTRFKINGLLAGILVAAALYSLNLRAMGESFKSITLSGTPKTTLDFVTTGFTGQADPRTIERALNDFLQMGFLALIAVILVLVMTFFLTTQLGLALRATGDNENMIRALGVNTDRAKILVLAISNGFFGLAGSLFAQYSRNGSVQMGLGMIIGGLAAVILGEAFIPPRTIFLAFLGVLVGSLVYNFIASVVFSLTIDQGTGLRFLITGLIVALVSYVAFLTLNAQTPSWVTMLCILLAAMLGAFLSTAAYFLLINGLDFKTANPFIKLEAGDVRIALAVLIFLAMAIPGLRRSLGMKAAIAK